MSPLINREARLQDYRQRAQERVQQESMRKRITTPTENVREAYTAHAYPSS